MITRKGHNLFKTNDYFAEVYSQNYDIFWTCITFRTTAKISEPLKMFWYNWWYTNFIFSCLKYLSSSIAFLRKRSCNEVTKRKIIKRPVVRYFSIFLFEIQKIFIEKCSTFIYNSQALPGSLKFQTWCFSLTLYTAIQTLDTEKPFNDTRVKRRVSNMSSRSYIDTWHVTWSEVTFIWSEVHDFNYGTNWLLVGAKWLSTKWPWGEMIVNLGARYIPYTIWFVRATYHSLCANIDVFFLI